jgi:hypothetical protein
MFTAQNVILVLAVWFLLSVPVSLGLGKAISTMDKAPASK